VDFFNIIISIPKSVVLPPETQYSLACVILSDGGHFKGISLDKRNSPGIHLIFDGILEPEERILIISLDDHFLKLPPDMTSWNGGSYMEPRDFV